MKTTHETDADAAQARAGAPADAGEPGGEAKWSLVSDDGRATARLRRAMVIGSGTCCDLCLPEEGVSLHHAILTVEDRDLYVTPLNGAPTRVDGEAVHGRCRLRNGGSLSVGPAKFGVRAVGGATPIVHVDPLADVSPARRIDLPALVKRDVTPTAEHDVVPAVETDDASSWPDAAMAASDDAPNWPEVAVAGPDAINVEPDATRAEAKKVAPAKARADVAPAAQEMPQTARPRAAHGPRRREQVAPAAPVAQKDHNAPKGHNAPKDQNARKDQKRAAAARIERKPALLPTERVPRVEPPRGRVRRAARVRRSALATAIVTAVVAVVLWWTPSGRMELASMLDRAQEQPSAAATVSPRPSTSSTVAVTKGDVTPALAVDNAAGASDTDVNDADANASGTDVTEANRADTNVRGTDATKANGSIAPLLSQGDALYAKGVLVNGTPNAVQTFVDVLAVAPNQPLARARLSDIVTRVAADASTMILRQRFNGARQLLHRLSVALPQASEHFVDQKSLDQWRVVELLLSADALMQKYQITAPEHDNAVEVLHEALRLDPQNAIADEMLTKAYGLLAERNQAAATDLQQAPMSDDARQR